MVPIPRREALRRAWVRLRVRLWPILQTAAAAVAAWYLAKLLVGSERPVFASIAAVISLGATHGGRDERATELIGGVVVGIAIADLLIRAIGTGPIQIGVLVVLAMAAAVLLGGGPVLVTEAAVSAIILASLDPAPTGLSADRLIEALVGGGVALAVSSLVFPLDPQLHVGRAAQSIFGQLGRVLEQLATALEAGDRKRAESALAAARDLDGPVRELDEALETARETLRSSPLRRPVRADIDRYARGARHVDYAVRNTRVLARHVLRFLRSGKRPPAELAESVRALGLAVWALAEELDDPSRSTRLRLHVSRATAGALETHSSAGSDLSLAEIVVQVRSTGIDLLRASAAATTRAGDGDEVPTEELLLRLPDPRGDARDAA
ncbi:MAG TPA: FUSC family protein [Thermoleophilaceae bacterium]|nr:FUSC family protein [Thermoleophilaceae bacterium]